MKRYGDPTAPKWRKLRGAPGIALVAGVALVVGSVAAMLIIRWILEPEEPRNVASVIALAVMTVICIAAWVALIAFFSPLRLSRLPTNYPSQGFTVGAWIPLSSRGPIEGGSSLAPGALAMPRMISLTFDEGEVEFRAVGANDEMIAELPWSHVTSVEQVEIVEGRMAYDGLAVIAASGVLVVQPIRVGLLTIHYLDGNEISDIAARANAMGHISS